MAGQIAEEKALKNPQAIEAAKAALAAKDELSPSAKELEQQIRNTASAPYGTGSALQQGIQAATLALQGLAGGDLQAAIAGEASPYLAELVKSMTTNADGSVNVAANATAHAVVGAVVAELRARQGLRAGR